MQDMFDGVEDTFDAPDTDTSSEALAEQDTPKPTPETEAEKTGEPEDAQDAAPAKQDTPDGGEEEEAFVPQKRYTDLQRGFTEKAQRVKDLERELEQMKQQHTDAHEKAPQTPGNGNADVMAEFNRIREEQGGDAAAAYLVEAATKSALQQFEQKMLARESVTRTEQRVQRLTQAVGGLDDPTLQDMQRVLSVEEQQGYNLAPEAAYVSAVAGGWENAIRFVQAGMKAEREEIAAKKQRQAESAAMPGSSPESRGTGTGTVQHDGRFEVHDVLV